MKKVIIVTSTPREGGNSEVLAKSFADGAKASGNDVRLIAVRDLGLKFCTGCMRCQSRGKCVLGDGMNALYPEFESADVLVFATPVYYYSVSGQLKTFLDRLNPLYGRNNKFRDVYLLATAADGDESAMDGAVCAVQGWIDCFDGVTLKGVIRGTGVTDRGDIAGTRFVKEAFETGKMI